MNPLLLYDYIYYKLVIINDKYFGYTFSKKENAALSVALFQMLKLA